MLSKYSDITSASEYPYHHHTGARALKAHFEDTGWNWNEYVTITTIRNPWDRVVSIYHYAKKNSKSVWNKHYSKSNNFDDFVNFLPDFLNKVVYAGGHLRAGQRGISIKEFGYSVEGEQLINYILPIEKIADSLPDILLNLGLPLLQVPKVNITEHKPWKQYYKDESQQKIVSNIFEKDIEIGNYTF
jgi:hypothetical protein